MNRADFAPFDGDGRVKAYPPALRPLRRGRPTAVTNATARRIIEEFQRTGESLHSPMLSTFWVLVEWCKHHGKAYEVWYWEGDGVSIHLDRINPSIGTQGGTRISSSFV